MQNKARVQCGNGFMKFYISNRTRKSVNQDAFETHWWEHQVTEKQENLFQVSDALVITLSFGLVEDRYLLKTHF